MFIFYKMEYVIAYKMLLKQSVDEQKKDLFWECHLSSVGACRLIDFHVLFVWNRWHSITLFEMFFVTPMLNISAPFNAAKTNAYSFCLCCTCAVITFNIRFSDIQRIDWCNCVDWNQQPTNNVHLQYSAPSLESKRPHIQHHFVLSCLNFIRQERRGISESSFRVM